MIHLLVADLGSLEGGAPHGHLVQDDPEGVQIGSFVDPLAEQRFRRGVLDQPATGDLVGGKIGEPDRQAEIRHPDAVLFRHENILGTQVPVQDPLWYALQQWGWHE